MRPGQRFATTAIAAGMSVVINLAPATTATVALASNDNAPAEQPATSPAPAAVADLMPQPKIIQATGEALPLSGRLQLSYAGCTDPLLARAAARFAANLKKRTGVLPDAGLPAVPLKIECSKDPAFGTVRANESYKLTVNRQGIMLQAQGQAGVLHGLATLLQLVELSGKGFQFAGAVIEDSPRFAWRGVLVDPTRHFIAAETLKRQIDAMEAVKLNVLHLHLSDNEGFRVESRAFPDLTGKASDGEFYTQEEIKDLIAYARDRGVRILPEFDVPGHCGGIIKAYPALGAVPPPNTEPSIELDPSRQSTYEFLEKFLDEMTALFPDAYYHIGGDEVAGDNWAKDPHIQAFMKEKGFKDKTELQAYFTNRVKDMLEKRGKTMLGWDEIVNSNLPHNVLVQSWHSDEVTVKTARAGYQLLVSNGYYLDMLQTSGTHYAVDPAEPKPETPAPADPSKKTIAEARLSPEEKARIIGAETCLWGEIATGEMIDARLWPRCAAIAERFWSPASVRDQDDMYRRLIIVDNLLSFSGLQQQKIPRTMVSRLVPEQSRVMCTFLDALGPAPFWSHFRRFRNNWKSEGAQQQFNEFADAASPDALCAKSIELDVKHFLAGGARDPVLRRRIADQLREWRDNNEEFQKLSSISPIIASAAARSQDLHDLSAAGLEALDMLEKGNAAPETWISKQKELLARQDAYEAATTDVGAVMAKPQPPAEILLPIHKAVQLLIEAARKLPAR